MISIAQPIIGKEERAAVDAVLASGNLAQGAKVAEFEEAFSAYTGADHAVAVSSGTAALHLALLAHGVGHSSQVITSPFSFISTANAVVHCGATPVFADVKAETFNMDPSLVEELITPFTKALMPVHLYGNPADLDPLKDIALRRGLAVIEDACQAHGAIYRGQKIGSMNTACFSFYPSKNMTTGEGGMVTTDDAEIALAVRQLRQHGMNRGNIGFNYRMTDIQAAIGIEQLKKLDNFNAARRKNAGLLSDGLSGIVPCPTEAEGTTHCWHQFTIKLGSKRQSVLTALHEAGIGARVYYDPPIHRVNPYFTSGLKNADELASSVLSLPVHPDVTEEDIAKMIEVISCALA